MRLTAKEILTILDMISDKHGPGYSEDIEVGKLQAKLSIMLQVASEMERKAEDAT